MINLAELGKQPEIRLTLHYQVDDTATFAISGRGRENINGVPLLVQYLCV